MKKYFKRSQMLQQEININIKMKKENGCVVFDTFKYILTNSTHI